MGAFTIWPNSSPGVLGSHPGAARRPAVAPFPSSSSDPCLGIPDHCRDTATRLACRGNPSPCHGNFISSSFPPPSPPIVVPPSPSHSYRTRKLSGIPIKPSDRLNLHISTTSSPSLNLFMVQSKTPTGMLLWSMGIMLFCPITPRISFALT